MKVSILSTILLALTISLTMTVTSTNLNMAFAVENYLKLRSADVNYHDGDIDVDIRTEGDIPSEKGNNGFGYAVLTDVEDEEFLNNVLVAISDIGIENYDESTENDKLHTYVLDITGEISSDCRGSDYEVARSSTDNDAFDTKYPIDVKGSKIAIDDVDTDDLDGDTVKAIASFTAEAITHKGKIQHVCIDIQDVLNQSEISTSYDNNDNYANEEDDNDDDNEYKSRDRDNSNDNDKKDYDDDSKRDDNGNEEEDSNDLFELDIDQIIDQSNECDDEAYCNNEGNNEANVFTFSDLGDDYEFDSDYSDFVDDDYDEIENDNYANEEDDNDDDNEYKSRDRDNSNDNDKKDYDDDSNRDVSDDLFELDIDQIIDQSNECDDEAYCNNEGNNEANVFTFSDLGDDYEFDSDFDIDQIIDQSNEWQASIWENNDGGNNKGGVDIEQSIQQSNECDGEASCSNMANNIANVLGQSSISDEDFDSKVDIDQSIEQSNTCSGGSVCSNIASNVVNVGYS